MHIPKITPEQFTDSSDELLLNISACKVSLLIRARSAWHGVRVQHFLGRTDIFSTIESAMKGAERYRERGNQFIVEESPALLLTGERNLYIYVDPNNNDSFAKFSGITQRIQDSIFGNFYLGIFPGVTLNESFEALGDHHRFWSNENGSSHVLLSGCLPLDTKVISDIDSFRAVKSQAVGTDYLLNWNERPNSFSAQSVVLRTEEWITQLELSNLKNPEMPDTELREIRDAFDEAVPRSVWLKNETASYEKLKQNLDETMNQLTNIESELKKAVDKLTRAENALETARNDRFGKTSEVMKRKRLKYEAAKEEADELSQIVSNIRTEHVAAQAAYQTHRNAFKVAQRERIRYR